jgi:hypothetical protein
MRTCSGGVVILLVNINLFFQNLDSCVGLGFFLRSEFQIGIDQNLSFRCQTPIDYVDFLQVFSINMNLIYVLSI